MRVVCPRCGKDHHVSESMRGRWAKCGGCQERFELLPSDPPDRLVSPDRPVPPEHTDRTDQTDQTSQTDQTDQTDRPSRSATRPVARRQRGAPERPVVLASSREASPLEQTHHPALAALLDEDRPTSAGPTFLSESGVRSAFESDAGFRPPRGNSPVRLTAVAALKLLIAAFYLALIAGCLWSWGYFAFFMLADFIRNGGGGWNPVKLLLAGVLLIAGAVWTILLVKPLSSRPQRKPLGLELRQRQEPVLFAFVEALCEKLDLASDFRIGLDLGVRIDAAPDGIDDGGLPRFALKLPLSLVAGLSAEQLAGCLARELARFKIASGGVAGNVIRWVDGWFEAAIWPAELNEMRQEETTTSEPGDGAEPRSENVWLRSLATAFAFGCDLVRGLLFSLYSLGQFFAGRLLRSVDRTADRFAINLIGDKAYRQTLERLLIAAVAHDQAMQLLEQHAAEGRRIVNVVAAEDRIVASITPSQRSIIELRLTHGRKYNLAGGESLAARYRRAERGKKPGYLQLDQPARDLVRSFDSHGRQLTDELYQRMVGGAAAKLNPTAVSLVLAESSHFDSDESTLEISELKL